ncbi:hypothetical protein PWY87_33285 [Kribbella solani]|nr:hypothetical protein [Kribbella solani]MDX2970559.1 hypothetical protein [Kribbella solani]MDX3006596.1 hypothetical protein [Kribbella solani]
MLILLQLVVYVAGVMFLILFGWIAGQLSPPAAPPGAEDEVRAERADRRG